MRTSVELQLLDDDACHLESSRDAVKMTGDHLLDSMDRNVRTNALHVLFFLSFLKLMKFHFVPRM